MNWIPAPPGKITEHFSWSEAACRCCGRIHSVEAVQESAEMMEDIRVILGHVPIKVYSWCRCPSWNVAVGGASDSFHMKGVAVDFVTKALSPRRVQAKLKDHDGGLGRYPGFVHVDCGPKRRWSG